MNKYLGIVLIVLPILILLLLNTLKDRFEPHNAIIREQKWSMIPGTILTALWIFFSVALWLYNWRKYTTNLFLFEYMDLMFMCICFFLSYQLIRKKINVSIVETFNLKTAYLRYILILCGILTILNIISIHFFDTNFLLRAEPQKYEAIRSMGMGYTLLFSFVTIIVTPIFEESIFRGLLYAPLYRKTGRFFAITLSSLIWTHGHFYYWPNVFGIFLVGIVLAWLYDRSGSLLHPIIFHMFKNSWMLLYMF